MKIQLWYKIRVRTTGGDLIESLPQVIQGAGVSEAELKNAVNAQALEWNPQGLFDMGEDEDGDRCLINARHIDLLWVVWLDGPP